jgi:lipopolysaccharide export system protein LptC
MDARFAVAARHSRMVRVLRVAVPAAVILAMAMIIVTSIYNPFRILTKLPLDIGNLVVSGTKITMESPHMAGYTTDQRPYEVWAKTATQDVTDPDHLDLKTIRAKLLAEDQSTVTMVARTGQMDTKKQLLNLQKDIFLQTSTGYEARLSQAFIDMANGVVTSDEHVDVKLTNGTITSDRIKITGNGEVITFEGNVVMHLDHFDAGGTPAEPAAAPPAPEPAARPGKARASSSKTANTK